MNITFETIAFYILLIDSIGANIISWFGLGNSWYSKHLSAFARQFPITQGWTTYYLLLVIWVGSLLYRIGLLNF